MDVLPVLHFVFIACRFFYEKASPHLWDQQRRGEKKPEVAI